MTKRDIVERLHARVGRPMTELEGIVEETIRQVKDAVCSEGILKLPGFGNFEIHNKKGRKGRNPHTGEEIVINGHMSIVFKPGPALKKALNG